MVAICTPTRDTVQGSFTFDLVQLVKHSPDTQFLISFGSYIANNRINLVNQALKLGCSHLLFLDCDMRFPPDTLDRLLAHKKDIVGANYHQRTQAAWATHKNGTFISSEGKTGLETVDSVGFGVLLIKASVFNGALHKLSEPWFAAPYHTQEKKLVTEDVYFCTMARENNFQILVDHDLSQEIKHTGSIEL